MYNCKVIAICNQKGGVTKTTTTVNLGVGLAMTGKRVLLVDIDPQADLTTSLGWNSNKLNMTLATIMDKAMRGEDFDRYGAILNHNEGVDLIPSGIELSSVEMNLVNAVYREHILKNYLGLIKYDYDYVLIDCPPSLSMLTINALSAADSVIIPVQAQYLPAKGMTQLIRTLGGVQKQINPNLKLEGVLLTLVDMRTNLARVTIDTLQMQYGNKLKIYKAQIPVAVKGAEISAAGRSIFAYDGKSKIAKAYAEFTREVFEDGERFEIRPTVGG